MSDEESEESITVDEEEERKPIVVRKHEQVDLPITKVIVHPLVLLSVIDHFNRVYKITKSPRVVGILLGTTSGKTVDVTNCFAVPFEQDYTALPPVWFLDHEYLESMHMMFGKVNAREKIVGWYHSGPHLYSTDIAINSVLKSFVMHPVLCVVSVKKHGIPADAYIEVEEVQDDGSVPLRTFELLSCCIQSEEAEAVGVEHLLRDIKDQSAGTLAQMTTRRVVGLRGFVEMLRCIKCYLEEVSEGSMPVNNNILYHLQEIFYILPSLQASLSESYLSETTDELMGLFLGSLSRAVYGLHNLIDNLVKYREAEKEWDKKEYTKRCEMARQLKKQSTNEPAQKCMYDFIFSKLLRRTKFFSLKNKQAQIVQKCAFAVCNATTLQKMGIKGLSKVIADFSPNAITERTMNSFFGRTIAIDASMSLYQFLIAIRQDGSQLSAESGETTSHLIGMFYRTIRMVENGIKPVYVFDGKPPVLKSDELDKRTERRTEAEEKYADAVQAGDSEAINKFSRRLTKVSKEHVDECKRLLKLMGIPYIEAPCEAEAQCAALVKAKKVFAAATEDMDTLTFGSDIMLRYLTFSEAKKMPIKEFRFDDVLHGLNMTHEEFVDFCILLGCDYCPTIKGVGPKKAYDLIKQYRNLETIVEKLDKKKYPIPENWQYKAVRKLFLEPEVIDCNTIELTWKDPDEQGLITFLVNEKNFGHNRVVNGCAKLLSARRSSTQGRIDSFFTVLVTKKKRPADEGSSKATAKKGKGKK
ncbi:Flap endonuclease [Trichinella spiralis]